MRRIKTAVSMILAFMLCFSLLPLTALADDTLASVTTDPSIESDADSEASPTTVTAPELSPEPTLIPELTPEPTFLPLITPVPTPESTPISEQTPIPTPIATPEPFASPSAYASATTVQPELIKVVSEPLVKVEYHYYDAAQSQDVTDYSDYAVVSSHSYYAIAMSRGENISIAANKYPGVVPVSTEPLRFRVFLNDSEDITVLSSYDAATGEVFLPFEYMGHKVTVAW
jgi:hypothetical protein